MLILIKLYAKVPILSNRAGDSLLELPWATTLIGHSESMKIEEFQVT